MEKIKVVALIGEAGSGKDFLLHRLLEEHPEYNEIVSCTTRPPREGEQNGINYYFLTDEEFSLAVKENMMLEISHFREWWYGTGKFALETDSVNIGVFNPEGIRNLLKHNDIDLYVFYVRTPAKTRLIRQLNREHEPDVNEIIRRYLADQADFAKLDFEYIELNNATYEDAKAAIPTIVEHLGKKS